ncbi:hypothetical protein L1049_014865 [Liquidambar formosana]|uniref:TF-B3 domain-containing protein n=1 Tax=Liquidambar formosana TaxID=63359 RepID=A0AAP0RXY4_LIQFO
MSDRAILKGPSGSYWHVEVCRNERGIYLENGWQCFLTDHSLEDNEFLVFNYDGNMRFDVQIFEKNGCERVDRSVINSHQESAFPNEKRKQSTSRKSPVGSLPVHQLNPCKNGPGTSTSFLRTQSLIKEETDMILETTTESFTSKFPYFKICLKKSSVQSGFIQPIPLSFAETNLPKCSTKKMILLNPKGRSWEVMCLYNGNRYAFSGGWGAFVHGNKLKIGDNCIFELVDEDKMQVHIF